MDLDITDFFNSECASDYSASVNEIGRNAAADTWQAAKEASEEWDWIKGDDEIRQALRDHFKEYGAWSDDEIGAWSDSELNALLIQDISGNMRDYTGSFGANTENWNWEEYEIECQSGNCRGNLFVGIDERVYFVIGI